MNNLFFKSVALISIILILGCSSDNKSDSKINNPNKGIWQDQDIMPVNFTLEQTYGNNQDLILPAAHSLKGPVADSAGNIYVIDGKNGVMYSFDADGGIRWETGTKGKGPGDFQRPQGFVTDGEYLYTANVSGSRIDQFDFDGNLINSTSLEHLDLLFSKVVGFLSDSLLVTTSSVIGEIARKIIILDTEDNLDKTTQFKISSTADIDLPEYFGYGFSIKIVDSLIAAGNVQDYTIRFFNSNGKNVKTITRDFNKLMGPGITQSSSNPAMRTFGSLDAPIQISDDYYITTLNWPTNVKNPDHFLEKSRSSEDSADPVYANSLDLYNAKGRLLYSIKEEGGNPSIGTLTYVDAHGKLYTKANAPFPQIRRYNFTITPPDKN